MDMAEKRMKETVSRLSQEVRTRVTAQDVEHLQQQAAGEYQPSPRDCRPDASSARGRLSSMDIKDYLLFLSELCQALDS